MIEELEYHAVTVGRLTVWVLYKSGQTGSGQTRLGVPSDRFDVLLDVARPCLRQAWIPHELAAKMHLIAENLTPKADCPQDLFESSERRAQSQAVAQLKREINARHGRFMLRSAAALVLASIYRDTANEYDICDVRGKVCF